MTFVSRVPVPAAFGDKASVSSEKCDNAGEQQEYFHIWFISLSGVMLRDERRYIYKV